MNKNEILRNYLDHIYFGNRLYGIQAAISIYFPGRTPDTLTDDDILDLVTRIHSPNI
jgi:membrane carboxypeptidase/penicillin-binding protein